MKRYLLFWSLLACTIVTMAQKPSLTKAYNFFYDKDFIKAKEAIDLCLTDEKLVTKAQTWLYQGNIYYFLANMEYNERQQNETYQIQYPDAPIVAYDAFAKSMEINDKAEAMDMFMAKDAMKNLYPLLLVRGSEQLIDKQYETAKSTLGKAIASYEMQTPPQYPMYGEIYLYYAYALEYLGDSQSLTYYEKALKDGSTNAYTYVRILEACKVDNNREKAEKILSMAKSNLPDEMSVRIAEVDYYYWIQDSAKAKSLLHSIPVNRAKSSDELINLSNMYLKENDYQQAINLLERAKVLSPNDFQVLFNLGACRYNLSMEYFNRSNNLAVTDPNSVEAQEYKEKSDRELLESAKYFEKARLLLPNDLGLLNSLRSIYARLQQNDKYDEINALIKQLEK